MASKSHKIAKFIQNRIILRDSIYFFDTSQFWHDSSIDLSFSILSHHQCLFTIHPIQNELYLTRLSLPFNPLSFPSIQPASFHGGNYEIDEDEKLIWWGIIHIVDDFCFGRIHRFRLHFTIFWICYLISILQN